MIFKNKNTFDASKFVLKAPECIAFRKKEMPPIMLDLRSADEYKKAHVAGAHNLPGEFLKDNLMQLPPFGKIILYAGNNDDVAVEAVQLLSENGFSSISYVPGGYDEILKTLRNTEGEVFLSDLPESQWQSTIESVLDEKVRPALASDGGGLTVLKIQGSQVYISYQGACSGCASSTTGTLRFIQNALSVALNHDIEVISA